LASLNLKAIDKTCFGSLGAGLERTVLRGIPVHEGSVCALEDIHGAGDVFFRRAGHHRTGAQTILIAAAGIASIRGQVGFTDAIGLRPVVTSGAWLTGHQSTGIRFVATGASAGIAAISSQIGLASLNLKTIDEAGSGHSRSLLHVHSSGLFFRGAGHLGARCCSSIAAPACIASISRKEGLSGAVCVAIVTVTGAAWLTCHQSTGGISSISACAGIATIGGGIALASLNLKTIDKADFGSLGAGLERTVLRGIPVHEGSVCALEDIHGTGRGFLRAGTEGTAVGGIARNEAPVIALAHIGGTGDLLGTGGELTADVGISVDERSILALLDVHGASGGEDFGTGLELAVDVRISVDERSILALLDVHGAGGGKNFGTGLELAVDVRISVDERSILALLDVHGAGGGEDFGTGLELAVDVRISVDERSILALLDVVGARILEGPMTEGMMSSSPTRYGSCGGGGSSAEDGQGNDELHGCFVDELDM